MFRVRADQLDMHAKSHPPPNFSHGKKKTGIRLKSRKNTMPACVFRIITQLECCETWCGNLILHIFKRQRAFSIYLCKSNKFRVIVFFFKANLATKLVYCYLITIGEFCFQNSNIIWSTVWESLTWLIFMEDLTSISSSMTLFLTISFVISVYYWVHHTSQRETHARSPIVIPKTCLL